VSTAAQVVPPSVKALQVKELQRRLSAVGHVVRHRAEDKATSALPEPKEVKAARAVVRRYEKKVSDACKRARDAATRRTDAARNAILFGRVDQALKLVEALEKEARNA
jgi:hypothetical protein